MLSRKCINAQSNNSIKFVKAGAKLSKYTKKLHSGLLHLTTDLKLLSDLGDKLVFPSFITITCLRSDIVLFSTSIKTVIILELTCLAKKIWKSGTKRNSLSITLLEYQVGKMVGQSYFFAVEVGARGYRSTSLKSCLLRLGLPSKLVRLTLKSLSLASLKASFQIWQARDSK